MAAFPTNSYITPEQAAMMAGIEDPQARMNTFGGMQNFANAMPAMARIKERDNGRVVGRTSPMEGLGQLSSQLASAYMNKDLMDRYGAIMNDNNQSRMTTARMIAEALRRAPATGSAPITPNVPDPYEIDGRY